jgi:hypothetical protein
MKLTDLFSQARKRRRPPNELDPPDHPATDDQTDRSSMAELVRLLREYDEAQKAAGVRARRGQ